MRRVSRKPPLSSLDARFRVTTRTQIAALKRRLGITTVCVTHDHVEAMTTGDRVTGMRNGTLRQVDSPPALIDSAKVHLFDAATGERLQR